MNCVGWAKSTRAAERFASPQNGYFAHRQDHRTGRVGIALTTSKQIPYPSKRDAHPTVVST
jgi:hypothetical protein